MAELRAPRDIPRAGCTTPDCIDCQLDAADPGSSGKPCPQSQASCGHHCNHGWTHDSCCWCGRDWSEAPVYLRRRGVHG